MKPSVKAGIDEENIKDMNILLSALNDLDSGKGNTNEILDIVNIIRKKDRQKERGEYEKEREEYIDLILKLKQKLRQKRIK